MNENLKYGECPHCHGSLTVDHKCQSFTRQPIKDPITAAELKGAFSNLKTKRIDDLPKREEQKADVAWLHRFINCVPFGEHCPAEDMGKAHRIVHALAAPVAQPDAEEVRQVSRLLDIVATSRDVANRNQAFDEARAILAKLGGSRE